MPWTSQLSIFWYAEMFSRCSIIVTVTQPDFDVFFRWPWDLVYSTKNSKIFSFSHYLEAVDGLLKMFDNLIAELSRRNVWSVLQWRQKQRELRAVTIFNLLLADVCQPTTRGGKKSQRLLDCNVYKSQARK